MTKVKMIGLAMVATLCLAGPAGAETASVARGKQLFATPGLGASQNATSCTVCHENGAGLEKAGAKPGLAGIINRCIQGPLQGEPLSEQSVAMQSLILYVQSLAQ